MYLKLMGRVNGDHQMVEIVGYTFHRHPTPKVSYEQVIPGTMAGTIEREIDLTGTAYILNRDGKTIETLATR